MTRRLILRTLLSCGAAALLPTPSAMAARSVAIDWKPFRAGSEAALGEKMRGRPFVLAFWSASCEPCREELPRWVRWQRRFPAVRIVLVTTDQGEDLGVAQRLLGSSGAAGLEHWALADEQVERVRWSVDPAWRGELPMTRFYDHVHRLDVRLGRLDPAAVERWLVRQSSGKRGGT